MPEKKHRELTVVHTFAVKPSQLKEARQTAFERDISVSKYICNALRDYGEQALKTNSEIAKVNNDDRRLCRHN